MAVAALKATHAVKWRRGAASGLLAAALGLAAASVPAAADDTATVRATYVISIGAIAIGNVTAETRITGNDYATEIRGSTSGITRLVADASALLVGTGRIAGSQLQPASYALDTHENGLDTSVRMALKGGAITKLDAEPQLAPAPDRVPVTPAQTRNVVDPVSGFMVALTKPGLPPVSRACNRTVRVFDGWQRFDIKLFYKETKAVDGGAKSYAGPVIVCGARYVPVAGHRAGRDSVRYMADNKRLEVWFAPARDVPLMVPYRILIGTQIGDLIIFSTSMTTDLGTQRASAE
jgi:hypothetical protein